MTNALVAAGANAIAAYGQQDPFAMAGEDMGGSNALYLKFNGTNGEWTYGQTQDELPDGTQLAVDMQSFRRGWICWKDSAVVEEVMGRVMDGFKPPMKSDLPDHGPYLVDDENNEGWAEQSSVQFKEIGGEQRAFQFKISSKSGLRALGTLLQDYAKHYKNHPGDLAIVTLGSQSFMPKVKKFGKKYAPRLPITGWANESALLSAAGDNPNDYDDGAEPAEGSVDALLADAVAQKAAAPAAPATPPAGASTAPAAGPRRRNF